VRPPQPSPATTTPTANFHLAFPVGGGAPGAARALGARDAERMRDVMCGCCCCCLRYTIGFPLSVCLHVTNIFQLLHSVRSLLVDQWPPQQGACQAVQLLARCRLCLWQITTTDYKRVPTAAMNEGAAEKTHIPHQLAVHLPLLLCLRLARLPPL
jgi:hypothetical protein